jgi:multicomponent Na+:H+ antiporter subunit D
MIGELPPPLIFAVGALGALLLRGRLLSAWAILVPLAGLANLLALPHGVHWQGHVLDLTLVFGRVDDLSFLFALLFHIAAAIGAVFAFNVSDRVQQVSVLLYAGAAIGAVLAGDLVTLFLFWEVMAIASAFLVWARRTERANRVGLRYILVQVSSGLLLLAGTLFLLRETGTTQFGQIGLGTLGGTLIFFAFGIKCAWPFLHSWLVDAYPESTPSGTVFLSAFTTKVAVYALARGYAGTEPLIYIGTAMAVFPIFYAVIENDLRRVLAYSLINQVGFMVVGIGIGSALALNGAVSHAFNDVLFKGLLFMTMGAVLERTGRINGSELGGLYKSMPITTVLCIVGAASISAFPLFSGFVSKSMVMAAAAQEGHTVVFLLLLFASAGVFHHAGIKIPYFAFFAHDSGIRTREAPLSMLIAMGAAAAICVFNGSYPWVLYSLLPWPVDYAPYTWTHVITQTQLLFWSALAFALLMKTGLYPPELRLINVDADWLYRRLASALVRRTAAVVARSWQRTEKQLYGQAMAFVAGLYRHHGPQGVLARTWPTGSTVLWVAVLLAGSLLLYYFQ